ncbi:MAG: hypothetical protein KF691_06190 [Phycisphaeraceae bacterium]|nr:hypothetical protein [Phycisphaeraceae bacterium]
MRFALAGVAISSVILAGCEVSDKDVVWIDTERAVEFQNRRESDPRAALFIDPRPTDSFESAHIPGAINSSLATFDGEKGIDPRIAQFESIVVYGQNAGDKSVAAVAKRMLKIGYSDVFAYSGGLDEWSRSRLPVQTGPSASLPPIEKSTRRGASR